jgi:hypothetical protein
MGEINILWSGGWDSTYRVLELLLIENQKVHPYYIIDPKRGSLANEIIAMSLINYRIQTAFPAQAAGLMPVELIHLEAIPPDEEITKWFQQLKSKIHIGAQYEWLPRFAKHTAKELELCVERNPDTSTQGIFHNSVRPLLRGTGHECRIEGPLPDPALQIFTYFRYPLILRLTKADMRAIAEEHGFIDIMKLTWFCHNPRNGLPCGHCRPCSLAHHTGFEYTFYQPTKEDKIHDLIGGFLAKMKKLTG